MRSSLAILLWLTILGSPVRAAEAVLVNPALPNPGNLLMYTYVPDALPPRAPLVVALHGCTQGVRQFDDESGWTELADRLRFAVVFPEQPPANNKDGCFNFFSEAHNSRDRGEAASIMAMVEAMRSAHGTDPARTFVTGLSAGGAMAAVMLAAYPEAFQAGAIIAGVPYGCASTGGSFALEAQKRSWSFTYGEGVWAALRCGIDRGPGLHLPPAPQSPQDWRARLAEAGAPRPASWPRVSLWQGREDRIVHPQNLQELLEQWTAAHGIDQIPDAEEAAPAYRRRAYKDARGETKVETVEVLGLDHAVPVAPGSGPERCGRAASRHFADVGVCAAFLIARFWGIAPQP